jgi:hypothetical protein
MCKRLPKKKKRIFSRTVADPGHLNQGSTATGSKASKWRRDFEFLQLNMHHSKGACFNLQHSLDRGLIDVALLQELWVYKSRVKGLNSKQGSIFVGTRAETRRACIFLKKINATLLNSYSNRDIVAVMIKYTRDTEERNLICYSLYLLYDSLNHPLSNKLMSLFSFSQEKEISIIIGCDSNSHHLIWGSINTNSRGAAFIEYLYGSHLEILNRGDDRTTFVTSIRQEVIDITLSSTDVSLSDHRMICFKIIPDFRKPCKYRNLRSTDWERFSNELAGSMQG